MSTYGTCFGMWTYELRQLIIGLVLRLVMHYFDVLIVYSCIDSVVSTNSCVIISMFWR